MTPLHIIATIGFAAILIFGGVLIRRELSRMIVPFSKGDGY